ncbi:MAG: PA14 domain-containing protein, partial [Akkermansiaceae bacterium]
MPKLQQQMKDKVLQIRRPHPKAKRPYDREFVPAVAVGKTVAGVQWESFQNDSPWLARLNDLNPLERGEASALAMVKPEKGNALLVSGYFEVPENGVYDFSIAAGSVGLLRVHDAVVIDAAYKAGETASTGSIKLKQGKHSFRFYTMGLDASALKIPELKLSH